MGSKARAAAVPYLKFLDLLLLLRLPLPDDAEHLAHHRLGPLRQRLRQGLPEEEGVKDGLALVITWHMSSRTTGDGVSDPARNAPLELSKGRRAHQEEVDVPALGSGRPPPPPPLLAANLRRFLTGEEEGKALRAGIETRQKVGGAATAGGAGSTGAMSARAVVELRGLPAAVGIGNRSD